MEMNSKAENEAEYQEHFSVLNTPKSPIREKYQSVLQILTKITSFGHFVASDMPFYIQLLANLRDSDDIHTLQMQNLYLNVLALVFRVSQLKGHREDFGKAGLPKLAMELLQDEKLRVKTIAMIFCLLDISKMTTEFVDLGLIDVLFKLLKNSRSYERGFVVSPNPADNAMVLKARRFSFQCLTVLSMDPQFIPEFLANNAFEVIQKFALEVNVSIEYKEVLSPEAIPEVQKDEIFIIRSAVEFIFYLLCPLENYQKLYKLSSKDTQFILEQDDRSESAKAAELSHITEEVTEKLMKDLVASGVLVHVVRLCALSYDEIALWALKSVWRLGDVIHLSHFTKEFSREVVEKVLEIAVSSPGHKRFLSFHVLVLMTQHVANVELLATTDIFRVCWSLAMEESGETLNSITKLMFLLSVHETTATELSRNIDCPLVLVKILFEDCKLAISSSAEDGDWQDSTAAQCLLALVNIGKNSPPNLSEQALIDSGAAVVFEKLISQKSTKENQVVKTLATMGLCYAYANQNPEKLPVITEEMLVELLGHLKNSRRNIAQGTFIFAKTEVISCLNVLCLNKHNLSRISKGLPLYIKLLKNFSSNYGKENYGSEDHHDSYVSRKAAENLVALIVKLSAKKFNLIKLVELGEKFTEMMSTIKDLISDEVYFYQQQVQADNTNIDRVFIDTSIEPNKFTDANSVYRTNPAKEQISDPVGQISSVMKKREIAKHTVIVHSFDLPNVKLSENKIDETASGLEGNKSSRFNILNMSSLQMEQNSLEDVATDNSCVQKIDYLLEKIVNEESLARTRKKLRKSSRLEVKYLTNKSYFEKFVQNETYTISDV